MVEHVSINDVRLPPDMVKDYTVEALKELNNQDEGSFYEFFQGLNLEDVKRTQQRREKVQEENRELAVKTCELQPQFEELKSSLRRKSTEVDELRDSYARKYEELKEYQRKRDDVAMKVKFVQAIKEVEKKSDDMASDFVAGKSDLSPDDFKDTFLELRQTYWMRKVKQEKLDELLKNQRPTPAPRASRTQPHPMDPAHSVPVHMQHQTPPYPFDSRRPSDPVHGTSMPPPYAAQPAVSMPRPPPPGHPFSSVPPSYPGGYPSRPPMRPPAHSSYAPYNHRY